MILDFIANYVEKQKQKKLIIKSELERQKTDYVFRFLLMNYEKQVKGTVDLPAFIYAIRDMKEIKRMGKLNEAYDSAKKCLETQWNDIDSELKEQRMYDADWAELQAEADEALLWGI